MEGRAVEIQCRLTFPRRKRARVLESHVSGQATTGCLEKRVLVPDPDEPVPASDGPKHGQQRPGPGERKPGRMIAGLPLIQFRLYPQHGDMA